jgi:hypothetical protein
MTVTLAPDGVILLRGVCPIEDAEALLRRLSDAPGATVDWSDCEQAHTAVIQVMMAGSANVVGTPVDPFLRDHIGAIVARLKSDA